MHVTPASTPTFSRTTHSTARTLLSGTLIDVAEWHCQGGDHDAAREVQSGVGFEVVVTRRGAYARRCRGETVVCHAGVATFAGPHDVQRIQHPVPGGADCTVFRVPEAGMRDLISTLDPAAAAAPSICLPVCHAALDGSGYFKHLVAARVAALHAAARNPSTAVAAEEQAILFVHHAVRRAYVAAGRATPHSLPHPMGDHNRSAATYTRRVHELIAARFHERLTLHGIAREVGCSPYHLSRLVAADVGVPIYRLVIQLRLRAALDRVLDSREPLSGVAFDAGFASQSHFGDAFRREFGLAPGAARRLYGCNRTIRQRLASRAQRTALAR